MLGRRRVRLSVGPNTVGKIVVAGCAVPAVAVAGLLILLTARLLAESLTEQPIDVFGSLAPHLFVTAVFLAGVYVLGVFTYAMVVKFRYAVFLDGTMLVERIGIRHSRVDLAFAEVSVSFDAGRKSVESIVARDPDTGAEVKVLVHKEEHLLPADELTALADAVTFGRSRTASEDHASEVADRLRELASGASVPAGGAVTAGGGRAPDAGRGGLG